MDELIEFGDFVTVGRELVKNRDSNAWKLGDLCVDFEAKIGRPTDPDTPTLSDLAREWDVDVARVSEWRSVAKFYEAKFRTFEHLSWSHYNLARRACKGDFEAAMDNLEVAAASYMGVREFRRHLSGILYEGMILTELLPDHLQMFLHHKKEVWITIKRKAEDE